MESITINDEYKKEKAKQQLIDKHKKYLEKQKDTLLKRQKQQIAKASQKIKLRYSKRIKRIEDSKNKKLNNDLRTLEWKAPLKKNMPSESRISTKVKQKAFVMFQLRCRLSRADSEWMVMLLDRWYKVHYKTCDAGHYYPKSSYPHIAFEPDNCRPISKFMNKQQWTLVWLQRNEWLVKTIGAKRMDRLKAMSNDKENKNKVMYSSYYAEQLELREKLVIVEKKRLGIL